MKTSARRSLATRLLCACAALAAAPAFAVCRLEPLRHDAAAVRAEAVRQRCFGSQVNYGFDVPRAHVMRSYVDGLFVERLTSTLESGLRLNWAGHYDESTRHTRTEEAVLASAWRWRVDERVSLNLGVGRELFGAFGERLSFSGLWQPSRRGSMFAGWSGTPTGTGLYHVGARLWLIGRKLALEAGAQHRPGGVGWTDGRVHLTFDPLRR